MAAKCLKNLDEATKDWKVSDTKTEHFAAKEVNLQQISNMIGGKRAL